MDSARRIFLLALRTAGSAVHCPLSTAFFPVRPPYCLVTRNRIHPLPDSVILFVHFSSSWVDAMVTYLYLGWNTTQLSPPDVSSPHRGVLLSPLLFRRYHPVPQNFCQHSPWLCLYHSPRLSYVCSGAPSGCLVPYNQSYRNHRREYIWRCIAWPSPLCFQASIGKLLCHTHISSSDFVSSIPAHRPSSLCYHWLFFLSSLLILYS